MNYLFRANGEDGNLVYGSVVYGKTAEGWWKVNRKNTHFFITDIECSEKLELTFYDDDDYFPEEEYYDDWQVQVVEIDWDTLEFNLNGEWIRYEVKE